MNKISGEFDDDDGEYEADYDSNEVDSENDLEISNDNDQDYDPDNITESGKDYDPFKCPNYDNPDPEYNPFKCPDYDNSDPEYNPFKCPDFDNEGDNSPSALDSEIDDNPENEPDDPIKEYEPESEPEKQLEGINNPSNSGTVTVVEPEQTEQGHEQEEKTEEFEWVTPDGEPERPGEPPVVMEIRADLEEWGYPCEPDEDYTPPELDQDSEKEPESEPDIETEQKSEIIPENELEKESEQASECEKELIDSETGEPFHHQPSPDAIPLEDLIEGLVNEQQKNPREETDTEPEQEPEMDFNKLLEQEEKEVPTDDQELKIEEEIDQENKIKDEIESQETQEELKDSLQESNLKKPQESKEEIDDTEKDNYEVIKKQYYQETGRRAIYAKKETKGFIEWKERKEEIEYKQNEDALELDKESKKKIQELKEESVEYLINSIKEAASNKKISEKTREELIESLKKYDKICELYKKFQNREISKREFEKEIKKIEKEFGEKLRIGTFLFKNFEGFRKYYNEIVRRAGKRVAMLQISHKTNRFLLNMSHRLEKFKKEGISQDTLEKNSVSKEWVIFLKNHIEELTDQEISKEIKEELQYLINQFTNNNKLLIKQLKEHNPRFDDFFKELKRSLAIYKEYKSRKYEKSLIPEGKRVTKKIAHQLTEIKKTHILQQILNESYTDFQKLKEILKENLYNNTSLNLKEKSTIIKIIQKDKLGEEDKTKLISALSRLPTKDLISLLGENFKIHMQNYLRWGYNFEIFEGFLHYIHKIPLIKQFIEEFNNTGNWIKDLRPTKTFINFLKEKQKQLVDFPKDDRTNTVKDQIKVISNFSPLLAKVRDNNIINKVIKAMILENPGKYNAYDIEKWFLISDTSARNQLKRIFKEDEYQQYVRTQKHVTIDTIRKIVEKRGGKCHTKTLKNAKSKLHLECAEGHHFFTTYDSIVYHDTWCPDCNIYVSETICRRFFERIFKRPFPKSYPKWLFNENGNRMELDGYNKDLGLAFEYQGIQHRKKAFGKTDDDLKNIQKEDTLKLKKCEENGVIFLQIPDDEIVSYNEMQEYIEKEYERKTGNLLKNIPKYDYREFIIYENKYAKKFREYVEKKGGTLITPYFSAKKEVTIICEEGHPWTTTPDSVYKDNWCSECAGNMKGTTKYFRKIGREFNCELLNEYVNAKEPLLYKCQKGHKFKKNPYWLKKDYKKIEIICPECKMGIFAEKFKAFINRKEGYLLTPYKGRFKPIKIKCKNNHVWETTPAAVYQGSWCKACKK